MAEAIDLSHFVRITEEGVATMDLAIDGPDCAACIDDIEGGLRALAGVVSARLNVASRRLAVAWRPAETGPQALVERLAALGYRAHAFELNRIESEDQQRTRWLLRCLAVASFSMMNVMLLSIGVWSGAVTDITPETRDFFHWLSALLVMPAAAYAGQPFFRSALEGLRRGKLNMDAPISIGVLLAIGMSLYETAHGAAHAYFDSAIMLLVFLLAGRTLDQMMRVKMRSAAANIAALKGEMAHRLGEDGAVAAVPVAALRAGDRVLLRPGDRAPADAVVLSGASDVDESVITGETLRRPVGAGAQVWAGSLNGEGALTLRVTAAGETTLLDEVRRLVDQASEARSRYRRLADRASAIYAPMVHLTALCTALGWLAWGADLHFALVTAIAVLIITCPCALALAVPAVQIVAAGGLFRAGVYLNASDAIERIAECDHVVFDKTGTLTLPMQRVANAADVPADLLAVAARLALSSRHPLAVAVSRCADGATPCEDARETPGAGVAACIDGVEARLGSAAFCGADDESATQDGREPDVSLLYVRRGAQVAALQVRQALRADAVAVVADLRARGLGVSILSGDRPEAVEPVARALGVADWAGGVRPDGKIARIAELAAQGRRVLMIGDGLNDAPALAGAHASLSPIDAVDMARAGADAVFLGERLRPVVAAVDLSRTARALMRQNLWLAVLYNAVAVPLAIAGFVTPLIAAAAMSGSSILVTLNALRARLPAAPAAPRRGRPAPARLATPAGRSAS
ncbi:MAG TPA: heavy metal translocating P-type ATPase [Beijerinckiaceae bacterium]